MKIMEKNAFLYESAIYLVKKPELFQGRKWLTKTGWARSNVAHRCRPAATPPPPGGAFYSAKSWVGNCPHCPPATYTPDSFSTIS